MMREGISSAGWGFDEKTLRAICKVLLWENKFEAAGGFRQVKVCPPIRQQPSTHNNTYSEMV